MLKRYIKNNFRKIFRRCIGRAFQKKPTCHCCKREGRGINVGASRIGPVSYPCCIECVEKLAEPDYMVHLTVDALGGMERFLRWAPFGGMAIADETSVFHGGTYVSVRDWLSEVGHHEKAVVHDLLP